MKKLPTLLFNQIENHFNQLYIEYPNLIKFGLALILLIIGLKVEEWL